VDGRFVTFQFFAGRKMSEEKNENVVGTLETQEKMVLDGLRSSARDFTFEIGQLELKKVQLIRRIGEAEMNAQKVLEGVGKRLEIPENTVWQVVGDRVIIVPEEAQNLTPSEVD